MGRTSGIGLHKREGMPWVRDEMVLVLELYYTLPGSKIGVRNPKEIELSKFMGRSAGSINARLGNFKSMDSAYTADGKVGMKGVSGLAEEVMGEYVNLDKLESDAERIRERWSIGLEPVSVPDDACVSMSRSEKKMVKVRCGQSLFRKALLVNYEGRCCVTGLAMPGLLEASHIKPYCVSTTNEKANPRNGLLLNALFHAAFDSGYITIDPELNLILSGEMKKCVNEDTRLYFEKYENRRIAESIRHQPGRQFIEYHNEHVFLGKVR